MIEVGAVEIGPSKTRQAAPQRSTLARLGQMTALDRPQRSGPRPRRCDLVRGLSLKYRPQMSGKLHVGRQHLWKGFDRHCLAADSPTPSESHSLLQIYAIECALKALLLHARRQFTTAKLDEDDLTHELDELLRCLGQPRLCLGQYTSSEPANQPVSTGRLHELFRYGGSLSPADRAHLTTGCRRILTWIEEQR